MSRESEIREAWLGEDPEPLDVPVECAQNDIEYLLGRIQTLEEALIFADPRNASTAYDHIAEDFYKSTGLMAPGKDSALAAQAPESMQREARERWRPFVDQWWESYFDRALGKGPRRP